ncbi:MAG TPA: hypothetical protein VMN60_07935 [Longimicrobiales bacterium]|nr:hypothetical protein [Longimicrobiales bacterium]
MTRFAHVLQRAEQTLHAPEPRRSRVLLELAQDLDDLFTELRAGGMTEDEAARRAESLLAPSPEAMDALCRVHAPLHVRLAERFSAGSSHVVERWLLTVATLLTLLSAAYVLASTATFATGSLAVWLLAALLAVAAWHGAAVLLQLRGARPSHMTTLLWLAGFSCVIGVTGATVEVWRMAAAAQTEGTSAVELFVYVGRAAEVLTFALALMMATLLVWFAAWRRSRRASAFLQHITREEDSHG